MPSPRGWVWDQRIGNLQNIVGGAAKYQKNKVSSQDMSPLPSPHISSPSI
jgi:hypothetical protein